MKVIRNIQLITPGQPVQPASLLLDGDRIAAITAPGDEPPAAVPLFDGHGRIRAFPGFIDIHTHGANGVDLSNADSAEAMAIFARAKLAEGVTTFLPTTWTASPPALRRMAEVAAAYRANESFAHTPFLHVEGPFLNPQRAGAQDSTQMRRPDPAEIAALHAICPIRILSLAPELPGALDLIRTLRTHQIITSAAHSNATAAQFRAAREAGLTHITHYGNQMSPLHHREIGLVGAALLDDDILIELICDTVHLCPDMVALVFKHRHIDQIMLITDSIAASHLGDGTYPLGTTEIIVQAGIARLPAGQLAGSTIRFNQALQHAAQITGLPLPELARCTAANQARSLGLDDRGTLTPGKLADIALLDENFAVAATIVGGSIHYHADPAQ